MIFEFVEKNFSDIEADASIVLVVDKDLGHKWVTDASDLDIMRFKGESEDVAFLPTKRVFYAGINGNESEEIKIAISKGVKTFSKMKIGSIKIGCYGKESIKSIVEGVILGTYAFDRFKSKKNETSLNKIIISSEDFQGYKFDKKIAEEDIAYAKTVSSCVNFARDIINTPPDIATPKMLAEIAENLAKESDGLECFIGDEKYLKKEKMGAFLAVSRASSEVPRFIHLTHKPKKAKIKIALVGKGLTYDSGGLSLKPSEHMATMKADKSGGCAVLAIMKALAKLDLPIEVHGIIGATENMIGGNAYKPDDVLISRSGKTVEIKNTDAEGRLVLCDCLDYAQDLKPDYIIDLATLTGACVVALGEYTTGVMGFNDELKNEFVDCALKSGELAATLPFNRYLKKLLKSEIADICHISSSRYGGAITAGIFLSEFIKDEYKDRWLHLDIAGPAFVEKEWGYNPFGASGAGVRMVLGFMNHISNKGKK